jgi:hypothetical protein
MAYNQTIGITSDGPDGGAFDERSSSSITSTNQAKDILDAAALQAALSAESATDSAASATAAGISESNASISEVNSASNVISAANSAIESAESTAAALLSKNAASNSETNSANSATAAFISEDNSANSAISAATSATASANSATNSSNSATASASSATNAASSANDAQTAQTAAETAETNAATSSAEASTSASNAVVSQSASATSATNAFNSATASETSASNASVSANAALASQQNAAGNEVNAQTYAQSALASLAAVNLVFDNFDDRYLGSKGSDPTSDNDGDLLIAGTVYWNTTAGEVRFYNGSVWEAPSTSATNSATSALASKNAAATSASNAALSETAASNSETAAAISESNAAASETAAGISEQNAAISEINAATSETNAATSEANVVALYDSFDDRYLGAKASAPSVDNDGNALLEGAFYWNTLAKKLYVYSGASWDVTVASLNSVSTDDISEGLVNQYYTTTRATEDVGAVTLDMTGFVNRSDSSLSFNTGTRTLTLTPVSTTEVYYRGKKFEISSPLSIVITNTSGGRYFYFDPTTEALAEGNIGDYGGIISNALVSYVYWDSVAQKAIIFGDERHSASRDTQWHLSKHIEQGAVWRSGGTAGYTLLDASSVSLAFSSPISIADEDVVHSIAHSASPSLPYQQVLEGAAVIPIVYLSGTTYVQTTASAVPWVAGTSLARYNPVSGGSGSLADVVNNHYMSYWIVATNDSVYPVKAIMGHIESNKIEDIEAEEFGDYGLPVPELVPMYHVILRVDSSYTQNTPHVAIAAVYKLTGREVSTATAFSATSHSALTNRGAADQHPISAITGLQTALDGKEAADATILKDADIGVNVQAYNTNTVVDASYVHTDNNYTSAEKTRLSGIEVGATADQTAAEILTLIKTVDGVGSGLDADLLDGQSSAYYATTASVTSAISTANSYTDTSVANLVDSSSATLDTLNELAAALGDDPNFATTVSTNIGLKADKTTLISAGTGLTGGGDLSANRTITHANSTVAAGTYGSSVSIPSITVDARGHVTAAIGNAISVGDGAMTVTAGAGLTGGGQVGTANQSGASSVTISHADTSAQVSVDNTGSTVIQDITLDTYGHITGLASKTLGYADVGAPSTTGVGASGTWGINVTGNAATATTLQTTRNINGIGFNGSANIDTTEWFHSGRDFPNGTLITTNINYAVAYGDPFVLEIRGNSYVNIIPLDLLYQGYIYNNTIISHGGISNGLNISGLVAINNGGNLCFWFPNQGYWNGYNVKVYIPNATRATNRVTSITGVAKPTTAKEVALSANIRQSLHSSNFNSYSPSLTGGSASGTWGISVSGNAATATTATTLTGDQTNWASIRTNAVANMLSWKNYGNNHIIFDASNSTSPTGSAVNNTNSANPWSSTFPTLMGWNGGTTYGVRVDSARVADTVTLAANSTLAGGLAVGSGVNNSANQIVRTNSSGYADFGWINTVSGVANGTPTRVYCSQDAYIRYYDMPTFTGYVRAAASGTWGINVTGNAATATSVNGNVSSTTDATLSGVRVGKGGGAIASNTAVGSGALNANTTGNENVAIGWNALTANTTAANNTAVGYQALRYNTGANNTASGGYALYNNTTGYSNTAIGLQALRDNTTGNNNTAIGQNALLFNTIGNQNTAYGVSALQSNTSGVLNTAIGRQSLYNNTTGIYNTAIGTSTLASNTTGNLNVAIGMSSLDANTTGSGNTAINPYNSGFGYAPVFNPTTHSNRFCMGSTGVTNAYIKVGWTVVSDARDKINFAPVPHGLEFVKALQPTAYQFRTSRDSEETSGGVRYGFKAQDVLALEGANPVIVDNEDEDKLRMVDTALIPVLVKALQELNAKFDDYVLTHP